MLQARYAKPIEVEDAAGLISSANVLPVSPGRVKSRLVYVEKEEDVPLKGETSYILAANLADEKTCKFLLEGLDRGNIVGVITRVGGLTSHFATVVREAGIPYVSGVEDIDEFRDGVATVDGTNGIAQGSKTLSVNNEQSESTSSPIRKSLSSASIGGTVAEVSINLVDEKPSISSDDFDVKKLKSLQACFRIISKQGFSNTILSYLQKIKVQKDNEQLAHFDAIAGAIVLDIDIFANNGLLLMELEHELNRIYLDAFDEKSSGAIKEIAIILSEVSRFMLFSENRRSKILSFLKSDNNIDEQGFYRILEKAQRGEEIFDDVINYVKNVNIYPQAFADELNSRSKESIRIETFLCSAYLGRAMLVLKGGEFGGL